MNIIWRERFTVIQNNYQNENLCFLNFVSFPIFQSILKRFQNCFDLLFPFFFFFPHWSNSWLLSWLWGFRGHTKGYKSLINSFIEFNTVEGHTCTRARLLPTQHIFSNLFPFDEISRSRNLSVWQNDNSTVCPIVEGRRFVDSSIRYRPIRSLPSNIYIYIFFSILVINSFIFHHSAFFFTVPFD